MAIDSARQSADLSRRSFVAGGAALGAAALGASELLGAGAGPAQAQASEAGSAPADPDPAADPDLANIAPVEPPASWDAAYDVIVVGSGGGLFAATRSQELGAATLCVEKMPGVGGASLESSIFAVTGTGVQTEAGLPDVSDLMLQGFLGRQIEGAARTGLITHVFENSARTIDWMSGLGFAWEPTTTGGPQGGVTGVSPKDAELDGLACRANMAAYTFLQEKFAELGGTLLLSTALTALVQDADGAIVGVQVEREDGTVEHYAATRGVLLACGGMAANRSMLREYVPSAYLRAKCNTAGPQDTGEAIRMGLGAGAAFTGFDAYQAFDGGLNDVDWNYYIYSGDVQLGRQAWLSIDLMGNRVPYYTEVSQYGAQARLLQALPGAQCYRFFDSHYQKIAPTFDQQCCRHLIVPTMAGIDRVAEKDWTIGAQRGIDNGIIKQGDTIEEVAEQLGIDPSVARQAVEDWNALCASGADDAYGVPTAWLHPIQDAPFYGVAVGSIMFSTHAGLLTNENLQVVSTRGTVIPGLYAAGCTMGGCCGPDSNYGCGANVNGGVAFAATTAFMAAEHMNGVLPDYVAPAPVAEPEAPAEGAAEEGGTEGSTAEGEAAEPADA